MIPDVCAINIQKALASVSAATNSSVSSGPEIAMGNLAGKYRTLRTLLASNVRCDSLETDRASRPLNLTIVPTRTPQTGLGQDRT